MNLQDILALDIAYLETFSKRFDRPWGSFFLNENSPKNYDSNHAHICEPLSNPQLAIDEVLNLS